MTAKEIEGWYYTTLNMVDDMYRRGLLDDYAEDFLKDNGLEVNDILKEFAQIGRRFLIKTDSMEIDR